MITRAKISAVRASGVWCLFEGGAYSNKYGIRVKRIFWTLIIGNLRTTKATRTSKFAYLAMKISSFVRFERVIFISVLFSGLLVLSTTWMTCFAVVWTEWTYDNKVQFCLVMSVAQFKSRIVTTHFASVMTFNNWEMIAETWSYIFGWAFRCHRRRVC